MQRKLRIGKYLFILEASRLPIKDIELPKKPQQTDLPPHIKGYCKKPIYITLKDTERTCPNFCNKKEAA